MSPASPALHAVPSPGHSATWADATEAFLRRHLSPGTRRVYRLTLERLGQHLDPGIVVDSLSAADLADALHAAYPQTSPASWNRHVATVRSLLAFCRRHGWLEGDATRDPGGRLERRPAPEDHSRSLAKADLERLFTSRDHSVRDRCLWRMLYETAARTESVLRLNIEDLNVAERRATTVRKGGATDVLHWATGTARLLPKVIDGRTSGPLFLSERAPVPSRAPTRADLDASTGRARLSYRRAAEVFTATSAGATLHQLRHSALIHLAEEGVPTVLLMAKSRHASLRTLQRYARPGVEAAAAMTAAHDPASRSRRG